MFCLISCPDNKRIFKNTYFSISTFFGENTSDKHSSKTRILGFRLIFENGNRNHIKTWFSPNFAIFVIGLLKAFVPKYTGSFLGFKNVNFIILHRWEASGTRFFRWKNSANPVQLRSNRFSCILLPFLRLSHIITFADDFRQRGDHKAVLQKYLKNEGGSRSF